jgi:hypothetical protein
MAFKMKGFNPGKGTGLGQMREQAQSGKQPVRRQAVKSTASERRTPEMSGKQEVKRRTQSDGGTKPRYTKSATTARSGGTGQAVRGKRAARAAMEGAMGRTGRSGSSATPLVGAGVRVLAGSGKKVSGSKAAGRFKQTVNRTKAAGKAVGKAVRAKVNPAGAIAGAIRGGVKMGGKMYGEKLKNKAASRKVARAAKAVASDSPTDMAPYDMAGESPQKAWGLAARGISGAIRYGGKGVKYLKNLGKSSKATKALPKGPKASASKVTPKPKVKPPKSTTPKGKTPTGKTPKGKTPKGKTPPKTTGPKTTPKPMPKPKGRSFKSKALSALGWGATGYMLAPKGGGSQVPTETSGGKSGGGKGSGGSKGGGSKGGGSKGGGSTTGGKGRKVRVTQSTRTRGRDTVTRRRVQDADSGQYIGESARLVRRRKIGGTKQIDQAKNLETGKSKERKIKRGRGVAKERFYGAGGGLDKKVKMKGKGGNLRKLKVTTKTGNTVTKTKTNLLTGRTKTKTRRRRAVGLGRALGGRRAG